MSPTTILDLPAELLDRIYWYLDWDRTASLTPLRADIRRLSLTCKYLRASVVPLIFRDVKLSLRWVDGELIEPSLYRLRRHRPDLAQHIRCVHVDNKTGYHPGEARPETPFKVLENTQDWLNPELAIWSDSQHYLSLNAAHRKRVDEVVRSMLVDYTGCQLGLLDEEHRAETIVSHMIDATRHVNLGDKLYRAHIPETRAVATLSAVQLRHQDLTVTSSQEEQAARMLKCRTDALAIVMLCLPATLTSLVFEASPYQADDDARRTVALHVLAAALKVFAVRLESLTTISNEPKQPRRHGLHTPGALRTSAVREIMPPSLYARLTNLRRLVLSPNADSVDQSYGTWLEDYLRWHALSSTITDLEIWNVYPVNEGLTILLKLAEGFPNLHNLAFRKMSLSARRTVFAGPPSSTTELVWLRFAIALRRVLPNPDIYFEDICFDGADAYLPASALRWLMHEAIPKGTQIGLDREQRLLEDFESFLPLWKADDSDRGFQAAEERKDGALIDAAMCSRWKQYSNVRRDRGEWTTM